MKTPRCRCIQLVVNDDPPGKCKGSHICDWQDDILLTNARHDADWLSVRATFTARLTRAVPCVLGCAARHIMQLPRSQVVVTSFPDSSSPPHRCAHTQVHRYFSDYGPRWVRDDMILTSAEPMLDHIYR